MSGLYEGLPVPIEAQIAEVEREIGMREMKQADADQKIAAMRAVLATLQELQAMKPQSPRGRSIPRCCLARCRWSERSFR